MIDEKDIIKHKDDGRRSSFSRPEEPDAPAEESVKKDRLDLLLEEIRSLRDEFYAFVNQYRQEQAYNHMTLANIEHNAFLASKKEELRRMANGILAKKP